MLLHRGRLRRAIPPDSTANRLLLVGVSPNRMQRRQERSFYASVAVVAAGAGKARLAVRPRSAVVSVGSCSGLDVAGKVDKYVVREGTLGNCTVRRGLLYDRDEEEDDDGRREWEVVYWGYIKLKSLLPLDTII